MKPMLNHQTHLDELHPLVSQLLDWKLPFQNLPSLLDGLPNDDRRPAVGRGFPQVEGERAKAGLDLVQLINVGLARPQRTAL